MKRFTTITALAVVTLVLAQCSPKPKAAVTSSSNTPAKTPASRFDVAFTADESAEGKVVYQDNCGRCHKLYPAESRTLKQWEHILPAMYEKGKITAAKARAIDAYVAGNARKF